MNFIYYSDRLGDVKGDLKDLQNSGADKEDIQIQKARVSKLRSKFNKFKKFSKYTVDKKFKWLFDDAFYDANNLYKNIRQSAERSMGGK